MPTQFEYQKRPHIDLSGTVVFAYISGGNINAQLASGSTVTALVSGQTVTISNPSQVSGQIVYTQRLAPTILRTRPVLTVPSNSGGTALQSGDIFRLTVEFPQDQQGVVYVGSETDPPFSGKGIILVPGGSWTFETDNFDRIRVFASQSGAKVAYAGEQYAQAITASGQQITIVLPGPITISGNVLYLASGQNSVQMSGQIVYTTSGRNDVQISGQTIQLAPNTSVLISGQPVSVNNFPTEFIARTSGQVAYFVSGQNSVQISGQTVQIAGGVNVSGATLQVSGQTLYLTSGRNDVQISGQSIQTSGQKAATSGDMAYLASFQGSGIQSTAYSGQNYLNTWISGQSVNANVSGSVIQISGQTVTIAGGVNVSGAAIKVSGETIISLISGQTVQIAGGVNVSGQTVRSEISGQTIIALISGQTINIQGGVSVSGNVIKLSDINGSGINSSNVSGQIYLNVIISGQPVTVPNITANISGAIITQRLASNTIRTRPVMSVTAASGGENLQSGDVYTTILEMPGDQQGVVYVGSDSDPPFSGKGLILVPGGSLQLDTDNFNNIRVFATVSGSKVSYLGYQYAGFSGAPLTTIVQGPINISGQTVYLTSGKNDVQISGQTVQTNISGNTVIALISGQTVVANVVTNISGQTVFLASGRNPVQISGQTVIAEVSGDAVMISGQVVQISGQAVKISGETITVANPSVSGNVVNISGQTVLADVYGSGHTQIAFISPGPSTELRNFLGVAQAPMFTFKVFDTLSITAASGGTALSSGRSHTVSIKNIGQSGTVMYVGMSGDFPWATTDTSGHGWMLREDDTVTIPIDNPAWVRVVSRTSGQRVSYAFSNY